jgi:hypothetical protein
MPDGAAALSRRLGEAIDGAVSERLQQTGAAVVRLSRSEMGLCKDKDHDCLARAAGQPVQLLVEVRVQKNAENSYFLSAVVYDPADPGKTLTGEAPYFTPQDPRTAGRETERALAQKAADLVTTLLDKRSHPDRPANNPPATSKQAAVRLAVTGPGHVTSEPPGIDCGSLATGCSASFAVSTAAIPVVLRARPQGAASLLGWDGALCTGLRCELSLSADTRVAIHFGRSPARKALTGILGTLGAAGLVSGAVLLGLNGSDAGSCVYQGTMYASGCRNNTAAPGYLGLGLGVAFGVGAALAWWLPTSAEK